MKHLSFLIVLASLMLLSFGLAQGQSCGEIYLSNVTGIYGSPTSDTVQIDVPVRFTLNLRNDHDNNLVAFTLGFQVYTALSDANPTTAGYFDALVDDSISIPDGWIYFPPYVFGHFSRVFNNTFSIDGIGRDTTSWSAIVEDTLAPGLPSGWDTPIFWIETQAHNHGDILCLDSSFFPPAGAWLWSMYPIVTPSPQPDWFGPFCFHVYDPFQPDNLVLTPDSLYFAGIEGGSSPPAQTFMVSSDGAPLNFNIVENISWAIPSPIQGTTVQGINVLINTIGLSAGTYIDSLRVESAGAANSPQYVKLVLHIEPPPPVIGVTPDAFFFNAIAGSSNPNPKTLTITNEGGSTLNWSVSHSESWLSLVPTAGVDSGDVTVSVDIAGLPYGEYYDTIVVSDPSATNDPVLVPVTLNVASDLPVIDVDSAFNFIVWPTDSMFLPPREIVVKNVGGGVMNFWLTEGSPRIFSLNPSSGTAPQTVEVGFKGGGQAGQEYHDTLWVYSNEAINSPFPVVFLFHCVEDPAELYLTRDSIQLNVFECDMGYDVDMPRATFFVNNIGGDNPLPFRLIYESDYFTTDYDSAVAPFPITVIANDIQLPLGSYYDTIFVAAQKAINSPETLIVQFNMIAGLNQPEIYLTKDSYTIPTQENAGPIPPNMLAIYNRFGGCMPWEIDEDVPWLFPNPDSGEVPGGPYLHTDAAGYVFGEYTDSLFVIAPSATNSPRKVDLLLRVWRFHGDWDYNCQINVVDLTAMVTYLFAGGVGPQPEFIVGDLDCSHTIDVVDLTYLVSYLFENGPIPCGNPY